MEKLKTYFPFAFTKKDDVAALIINIILHAVIGILLGWFISLLNDIPFLGLLVSLLCGLLDLYITASVVLSILHYFKILK